MNKLTCSLLVILLAIGLATRGGELQAQPPECGADDAQCLDDALALACGSKSDHASCLAWLESVEAHALTDSPEWRLIAALGYAYIPSFSDSRSEEQFYWERSAALFREVIARWPDSPYAAQANICLAGLTNDNNEAISLLREAMRADPSNTNTPYLLAARLAARGQNDDYREAPDFYRKTYSAWSGYYSAANALRLYALGGHTDQADEFRAQVERDSGMIDFAAEVVSAQFSQNQERASHVLEVACEKNIRAIFGPEVCSKGIDTLVAATRTTNYVPERGPLPVSRLKA